MGTDYTLKIGQLTEHTEATGARRTALRLGVKPLSIDVVDSADVLVARLNLFEFGHGGYDIDVHICPHQHTARLLQFVGGHPTEHPWVQGASLVAIDIRAKAVAPPQKTWRTHNDDPDLIPEGTSLRGYISIRYDDLVQVLGQPREGDPRKTDAEWIVRFEDGTIMALYNYKNGRAYLGAEGVPVEAITSWNIGGATAAVLDHARRLFPEKPIISWRDDLLGTERKEGA